MPSTDYPFFIHVDSSNVGTGCILIQPFPDGKQIFSFNSRSFDKAEQKMSTHHPELCGIVSALQTDEYCIIGSSFPIPLYCYHLPILYFVMGTKMTIITSVLQVPSNHHKIPKSQDYLDSRIKSCLSGCLKPKRNSGGIPEATVKT